MGENERMRVGKREREAREERECEGRKKVNEKS